MEFPDRSRTSARSLRQSTAALLGDLGGDVAAVGAALGTAGARGRPRSETRCVVAAYLSAVIGAEPQVTSVRVTRTAVVVSWRRLWWHSIAVPLTPALRDFIIAFDAEAFPTLIDRSALPEASLPVH